MSEAISKYYNKHIRVIFVAQQMINGNPCGALTKLIFSALVTSVAQQDGNDDSIVLTISKTYITWAGMSIRYIFFTGGEPQLLIRTSDSKPYDPLDCYKAKNIEIEIID